MKDLYKAIDNLKSIVIESNEGKGDSIEERVTYKTLAKLSGIKNPNKIFPGQKVTLPGGKSYTVKKGDTLSGIAEKYRLSQVAKLDNPMAPPEKKISQKMSPGNPFSPDKRIDTPKSSDIKPIKPIMKPVDKINPSDMEPVKPKIGDELIGKIGKIGKDIYNFADRYGPISNLMRKNSKSLADRRRETKLRDKGINPYKSDTKIASNKTVDMTSKQPTKSMIEQITGKKTCL